jgi:3-deoxy-manno-octulosonate cytidylyltransferase (CMP-KDO synthetase)
MKSALGVIPARYGSTRFPGKILAPLCGRPLVLWVLDRVRQSAVLEKVLVATDDERIVDVVRGAGADAVYTSPDHPSGTDRIAEAVQGTGADVVVNIQGDEPLIDPALIDRVAGILLADPDWDMATAAVPIGEERDLADPSVVKAVFNARGQALYFSRAAIPFVRDREGRDALAGDSLHYRHIGLYAYQRPFLERFVQAPPCALEEAERLEQLRALHLGGRIHVSIAKECGPGVDTPQDVPRAEAALRQAGLAV